MPERTRTYLARRDTEVPGQVVRLTHGRHCACGACAAEDWTNPDLAPCGMHGSDCPPEYQPLGAAGRDCVHGRLQRSCPECAGLYAAEDAAQLRLKLERIDRIVADYETLRLGFGRLDATTVTFIRELRLALDTMGYTPGMDKPATPKESTR